MTPFRPPSPWVLRLRSFAGWILLGAFLVSCRTANVGSESRPVSESIGPALDSEISASVEQVSEQRLMETLRKLVGMVTRHTCADPAPPETGPAAARLMIEAELSAVPGMKTLLDPFPMPKCAQPVTAFNVVGFIPGKDPRRLILVGGHYDSLALSGRAENRETERWTNAPTPAPGADDSGSQAALVVEAAHALAGHAYEATIAFVTFAGEEQGLVGSKALALSYQRLFPEARLEAVLNSDIVGGDTSVNDPTTLHQFRLYSPGAPRETGRAADGTNDSTSPSRGLARFVGYWSGRYVPTMTEVPRLREDRIGRGGDHSSFIAEGIAAVRFIETQENVAHQHSAADTVANIAPDYLRRMTQVVAASAAALARAPAAPTTPAVSFGNDGRTRLTWSPAPRADHYVVAARPVGELYYRKRIPVAASETSREIEPLEFGILPVEPFFVSVAAVDSAGHESLFAYPEIRCDGKTCAVPPGALEVTATVK